MITSISAATSETFLEKGDIFQITDNESKARVTCFLIESNYVAILHVEGPSAHTQPAQLRTLANTWKDLRFTQGPIFKLASLTVQRNP